MLGGELVVDGVEYESLYFIKRIVDLWLDYETYDFKAIYIRKGHIRFPVDDIYTNNAQNPGIYSQCKQFCEDIVKENILGEFIQAFNQDSSAILELVSTKVPFSLGDLCHLVQTRYITAEQFWNESDIFLRNDTKKQLNIIYSLLDDQDLDDQAKQRLVFDFLRQIKCAVFHNSKETLIENIKNTAHVTKEAAKSVFDLIHSKVADEWLEKDIDVQVIKNVLRVYTPQIKNEEKFVDSSILIADMEDPNNELFFNKLKQVLDFIKEIKTSHKTNPAIVNQITTDLTLTWHFFKNLKDIKAFPILNQDQGFLPYLTKLKSEHTFKVMLIDYLKLCAKDYGDDIVPLIINLVDSTKTSNFISKVVDLIGTLKIKDKQSIKPLVKVMRRLVKHQDPWLRSSIPATLRNLAKYDFDNSLVLLEALVKFRPVPKDMVKGDPTLRLKFSGRDNENMVLRHSAEFLSDLLRDADKSEKTTEFTIKLEEYFLLLENRDEITRYGMKEDYSYIWFKSLRDKDLKYESDMKERIPYEILTALISLVSNHPNKVRSMVKSLLLTKQEIFYIVLVQFASKVLSTYPEYAKEIIFNENFWWLRGVRRSLLQGLISNYLVQVPTDINSFYQQVINLNIRSKDLQYSIQQDLIYAIPKALSTTEISNLLKDLEKKTKSRPTNAPLFYIGDLRRTPNEKKLDVGLLKSKSDQELIEMMKNFKEEGLGIGMNDLALGLKNLVVENLLRSKSILKALKSTNLDPKYASSIVEGVLQSPNIVEFERLNLIWKILPLLRKTDTWAKKQIIDFIGDKIRHDDLKKTNKLIEKRFTDITIKLSYDEDPVKDREREEGNIKPLDAINHAINTVRGKSVEVLILLLNSYPNNEKLKVRISELSRDSTKAVRANLIYNLKYLIKDNYKLCKSITDKFIGTEDIDISFSLINYYSYLGVKKFKANLHNIELLFNVNSEDILSDMGELYGHRVVVEWRMENDFEEVIKGYRGDISTRKSIAFILESHVEEAFKGNYKVRKILDYIAYLTNPDIEHEIVVRERATLFLDRPNLSTKYFKEIESAGIIANIVKDRENIYAQSHLVNYFVRCVIDGVKIDTIIIYLAELVTEGLVFADSLVARDIAEIITILLKDKKFTDVSKEKIKLIISVGLEKGYEEFYTIYNQHKSDL